MSAMKTKSLKGPTFYDGPYRSSANVRLDLMPYAAPLCSSAAIWMIPDSLLSPPHKADGVYEINYLHKGSLTYHVAGQSLHVGGGDVSILQPTIEHGCGFDSVAHCSLAVFCVKVNPPCPAPPFAEHDLPAVLRILRQSGSRVVRGCAGMDAAFIELQDACRTSPRDRKAPWHDAWVSSLVHRLLVGMVRSLAEPVRRAPEFAAIAQARDLMVHRLTEDVSMAEIARSVGLSRTRFSQLFMQETGQTPHDYRTRLRVEAAAREMRLPSTSVTGLAMRFGFASSQHFAVCFKKYVGLSPSVWRKTVLTNPSSHT